jgi:hypothetical protein
MTELSDMLKDTVNSIGGLFSRQHKELVTIMRQPTPIKISVGITTDSVGSIGGGVANPKWAPLWRCPESQEAWINRIAVSVPMMQPSNPIVTGEMVLTEAGGPLIAFFPESQGTAVMPIILTEGRLSAAHISGGNAITVVGDGLASFLQIKFDFQIVLVQGVSDYSPRTKSNNAVDIMP